ncbi:tetratricopeptide repeat protein [bacterium]|nr:tetratricopeptide repeat protein [bacterium]
METIHDLANKAISAIERVKRENDFFNQLRNPYSNFLALLGMSLGAIGKFEEGRPLLDKALRFSRKMNDSVTVAIAEYAYGLFCDLLGNGAEAIRHLQHAVKVIEEKQYFLLMGFVLGLLGWGYYLQGELKTARSHLEKAIGVDSDLGLPLGLAFFYNALSLVHFDQSDFEKAQSSAQKALENAQKFKLIMQEGWARILLGRTLCKKDISQSGEAEEFIVLGTKILEELKSSPLSSQGYLFLGELYVGLGRKDLAVKNLKRAESAFQEMGIGYWLAKTQQVLERL